MSHKSKTRTRFSHRPTMQNQMRHKLRHLHRLAAVAATVSVAATPSTGARADQTNRPKTQRVTTPPLLPTAGVPTASTPPAGKPAPNKTLSPTATPVTASATAKQTATSEEAAKNSSAKPSPVKPTQSKPVPVNAAAKALPAPRTSQARIAGVPTSIARSQNAAIDAIDKAAMLPMATTPKSSTSQNMAQPVLVSRHANQPPVKVVTAKVVEAQRTEAKNDDRKLLAQLDEELRQTEVQLKSTDEKLSDGQRELMGLSNTLRSVMIQDGEKAAGLHPFVRVASRYAGTPYVWGGESRYGFDCSGFIIRVMRDLGYKALPHSAAEQFKYGTPVAQKLLQPGDIVFFANTYKPGISHVGIYIGKRRFIHAASTREGTIVSSLDQQPYSRKYAGARRLVAVKKKS